MNYTYKCTQNDTGKSVKQLIYENFSLSSRTLSKLKNTGGIALNGTNVTVRKAVSEGDVLTLTLSEKSDSNLALWDFPIDIICETKDFLAVNKPSAMPTHPCPNNRTHTLANAVMNYYKDKDFTFRPVTRLDGDTTGVVLIAKNAPACAMLSKFLTEGSMEKQYLAICRNVPSLPCGAIDVPIARQEGSVIKREVSPLGKNAITEYEVLKVLQGGKYSLIRCFPKTGRTHQIRLHMSHIGCPLYGDFLYGTQIANERALLHCERLTFPSLSGNGEFVEIYAPLPEDFEIFLS